MVPPKENDKTNKDSIRIHFPLYEFCYDFHLNVIFVSDFGLRKQNFRLNIRDFEFRMRDFA